MTQTALFSAAAPAERLPGASLAWVDRLRRTAAERFEELGWPTAEQEAWRFTPLGGLPQTRFSAPPEPARTDQDGVLGDALLPLDAYRLVFVNGRYVPRLSSAAPAGVALGGLAAYLKAEPRRLEGRLGSLVGARGEAFAALNSAYFADGAYVHLAKGVRLERPIHVLFSTRPGVEPAAVHPRLLVVAEADSAAVVVEEHAGRGAYFSNPAAELFLEAGSSLEHVVLQRESLDAWHVAVREVRLQRDARYSSHAVDLGAGLARHDLNVALDDEGAEARLGGLYLAAGRQLVDHHTTVDHARPHGTSDELYKGVLAGHARAVFNGSVVVRPAAQKTNARVYNKNLLLSEDGLVHTKPDFRIHANDVQCKHGAAIGQLSGDAMFYLRARGISAADARRMLVLAFAGEPLGAIRPEALREALSDELGRRLGGGAL